MITSFRSFARKIVNAQEAFAYWVKKHLPSVGSFSFHSNSSSVAGIKYLHIIYFTSVSPISRKINFTSTKVGPSTTPSN